MCYNILCDKYCTRQLYGYCPPWALSWDYRKKLILDEIRHYNADVVSLQEVETEQFYTYFQPELKKDGYAGVFSAKSRARTMAEQDRKHVDGCAIFYKSAKFRVIKDHLVEFNQLAIEAADGSHDMINRVMTKDNIGLALLLETTDGVWSNGPPSDVISRKQLVLVATCHVHWDPEFCDVKLIQTMMLMHRLQSIIKDVQSTYLSPGGSTTGMDCNQLALILCGDLNSLPDSGVVEYLSNGRVNANHKDFKDIGYDCLCKLSDSSDAKDIYTHGFHLLQAYSRDILPFTNYTYEFKGIIDYIFYGQDMMRPLGVLGSLDWSWFEQNRVYGCPHPSIPSDHLPLLVQFELLPSASTAAVTAAQSSSSTASSSSVTTTMGRSSSSVALPQSQVRR
jgi:CCR4-NOT transcription complex subunit 6